jgi:outer membrane protein
LVSDQITALAQSQLRTQLDVSFANVNLSDAKLLQLQAENGINSAEAELATALGLPNQTTFDVVDEPMPAELPTQADTLIAQAMQNRPDLKNLQLLQSAAERFTRAEHDLYYPTVNALVAAGGVPAGEPQIAGHYAAAGVNVNIPVFNGGLFKARESEAAMRAKAAAQNVADLSNRITRDVRVAWLNANTGLQRVTLTQQFVAQAQVALDLAQSRYQLGLSSIVELSQAQLNLTSAQIESATARYDYQTERSLVDYQTGVLR